MFDMAASSFNLCYRNVLSEKCRPQIPYTKFLIPVVYGDSHSHFHVCFNYLDCLNFHVCTSNRYIT